MSRLPELLLPVLPLELLELEVPLLMRLLELLLPVRPLELLPELSELEVPLLMRPLLEPLLAGAGGLPLL